MGALLALASSLAWGCADFAGGLAARRVGTLRVITVSYPAGAILLTFIALLLVPGTIDTEVLAWSAGVGVVGIVAMFLLYGALVEGPMGIVSPLTALGGAAVPVAVGLARGEALTLLISLGLVLAIVAVILVSREPRSARLEGDASPVATQRRVTTRTLLLSAGAGLFIGLYLTGLGIAPASSGIWVTTLGRWLASGIVLVIALIVTTRAGRHTWSPYPWALAIGSGLLDSMANGLFQLAAQQADLVVVAAIGALYPAATLMLAHWLLHERLSRAQAVGVALALAAAVSLSV